MSLVLNKKELLESNAKLRDDACLRRQALDILEAGLEAINTEKILRKKISLQNGMFCVEDVDKKMTCMTSLPFGEGQGGVYFVGIGKCALDGAKFIEDILGDYLTKGAVIDVKPDFEAAGLKKTQYFAGTHPYPSEQNITATKEILKMVQNLTEKDLVITLISGGGSALFELPDETVTAELGLPGETGLETIARVTKEMTARGADIYELNKVRKRLSQVKGGKFAKICSPAQVVSLLFSDVLGNNISVIASGPTVPSVAELPSPESRRGKGTLMGGEVRVKNILLVSNRDALNAMKIKAEEFGFNTTIETEKMSGNASEIGQELALREPKSKTCVLLGGETTVRIPQNHGMGGRNQEMALAALLHMMPDSVLICAASDGWDNSDHAGAIADTELSQKTKAMGISPEQFLMHGDSYNFFKQTGGAICTGKLGSNVSDLYIMLYK